MPGFEPPTLPRLLILARIECKGDMSSKESEPEGLYERPTQYRYQREGTRFEPSPNCNLMNRLWRDRNNLHPQSKPEPLPLPSLYFPMLFITSI